jgi:uncharacterized protein YggE
MRRFYGLVAVVAIAAVVLGFWLVPTRATSTETQETPTISVNGTAKIKVVPDIGTVTFEVETTQKTASLAMAELTTAANAVTDALKNVVKDEKNIKTSGMNVYPVYDYTDKGTEFVGYKASAQITVKSGVDDLSKIIDTAFGAGATGMNGIYYEYSKTASVMDQLLQDAMADARHKAEVTLSAEHATPGKLASVQVLDSGTPIWFSDMKNVDAAMTSAGASSINVMPGEQEISVSVSVSYVINQ